MSPSTIETSTHGGSLSRLWKRWGDYLLSPVDGSALAVFRILFGLLMAFEFWWALRENLLALMFLQPAFLFSWFPFIQPWPGDLLYVHYQLAFVAAILVALGLFFRVSAAFLGFSITYFFLLDKANFVNHFYLIALLSSLLAVLPAHHNLSLDRYLSPGKYSGKIPRWTTDILKWQVVIIYLFAASWKLNPDWLAGVTCHELMAGKGAKPIVGPIITQDWFAHLMAYTGIAVDYSVPILLLIPRTVWLAILISAGFHLFNSFLFKLGYFPWLMLGSLVVFLPYDWPRVVIARVQALVGRSAKAPEAAASADPALLAKTVGSAAITPGSNFAFTPLRRASALIFFHVFMLIQILLPLRCLTYPGNPDWTEQGYYFCWRLMVNCKKVTAARFHIRDASTGETLAVITGKRMLNNNQLFRMEHHPEMSHQFAHWLADRVEKKTGKRPIINVVQRASLHGRPWQLMIDPTVDLAAQPLHWGPKSWIVPLKPGPAAMNVGKCVMKKGRSEDHGKLAGNPARRWW